MCTSALDQKRGLSVMSEMRVPIKEVTGWLCLNLPTLRQEMKRRDLEIVLETVVDDARRGLDVGPMVRELLRLTGVPGGTPRLDIPGTGEGPVSRELYACPIARCDRRWVREPGT